VYIRDGYRKVFCSFRIPKGGDLPRGRSVDLLDVPQCGAAGFCPSRFPYHSFTPDQPVAEQNWLTRAHRDQKVNRTALQGHPTGNNLTWKLAISNCQHGLPFTEGTRAIISVRKWHRYTSDTPGAVLSVQFQVEEQALAALELGRSRRKEITSDGQMAKSFIPRLMTGHSDPAPGMRVIRSGVS